MAEVAWSSRALADLDRLGAYLAATSPRHAESVVRRLRAADPELPVLFASGYAEALDVPAGMAMIGKPFSIDQLRDKVKSMLVA